MTSVEQMLVVVPARNEALTVVACIESIDRAAAVWGRPTDIVLAADCCADGTAATAESVELVAARLLVLTGDWNGAGSARAAGAALGLAAMEVPPDRTWIASTDADSTVPFDWLTRQAEYAVGGADLVLGTVDLPEGTVDDLMDRFHRSYASPGDDHPHVHGANLGLRASAYLAIGGWNHLTVGEEHDLVARAVTLGLEIRRERSHVVITSARTRSRVRDGFADHLARLADAG